MSYANERCAPASSQEQNKDIAKAKGEAPNSWTCDQLKTRNLKKMPHRWVDTWARDSVMWYWSAVQLPININVQYPVAGSHTI